MGLPITPSEYGKAEEVSNSFRFRNSGQIRIPKSKREIAFIQSVDIQIESIDFNLYENSKANPPIQFYGYATLAFQDALALEIPIRFPRQRIHYDRNWEAERQWETEARFWDHWQLHRWNEIKILEIQGALGIEDIVDFTPQFRGVSYTELPLREVYIKLQSNSQFELIYTQYQPIPYEDPFGNLREGKSGQIDGDKDFGLPEEGIQPRRNSPSNPFANNLPETPPSVESGFFLSADKLTESTISGSSEGEVLWVRLEYFSVVNIDGTVASQTQYFATELDPFGNPYPIRVEIVSTTSASFPCGGATTITNYQFFVNETLVNSANWRSDHTWVGEIGSGEPIPTDSAVTFTPNGWCSL